MNELDSFRLSVNQPFILKMVESRLLVYVVAVSYNLHSLKLKINSHRLNRQNLTYR